MGWDCGSFWKARVWRGARDREGEQRRNGEKAGSVRGQGMVTLDDKGSWAGCRMILARLMYFMGPRI
jgi:hypothetical protein